jgi:hypothetical protein
MADMDRRELLRHLTGLAAEHGIRVVVTSQLVSRLDLLSQAARSSAALRADPGAFGAAEH